MMRGILSLTLVLLASADFCELKSGDVVTEGLNSALFIWASTQRCKKGSAELTQAPVMCEQDLASSIQSVSALASAIASMVGDCSDSVKETKCAVAANDLVSATSGLAAAVGQVYEKCTDKVPAALAASQHAFDIASTLGFCTSNAASSMDSIFAASNILQAMKKQCGDGASTACTVDALDAVSVLSAFGSYIAEAVGHCETAHNNGVESAQSKTSECAGGILGTIADLGSVANLGLVLKDACASSKERLYVENKVATTATGSPLVLALAAVLPLTAVLSFVAGKRFAKGKEPRESRVMMPVLLEEGSQE